MTPEEKQDIETRVKAALEEVRPYLQNDGGDVQFVELSDDLTVYIELQGHCGDCPYSLMTLKQGIEEVVKEKVPEIKAVEKYQ
jgi:Thioredoxin-like proteins and domains